VKIIRSRHLFKLNAHKFYDHDLNKDLNTLFMTLAPFYIENMLEAGIDEAGRGPLFGSLYVAAVILPFDVSFPHELMRDSKKISERKRLIAFDLIKEYALDYSIVAIDEAIIDKINIFQATQLGMKTALNKLLVRPQHILVDGNYFKPYISDHRVIPHTCIEGGDNLFTSIAAASILAKVSRDNYIYKLCDEYGNLEDFYNLRNNKGYGTKKHMEGIKNHGITQWHRRSFGICKNYP